MGVRLVRSVENAADKHTIIALGFIFGATIISRWIVVCTVGECIATRRCGLAGAGNLGGIVGSPPATKPGVVFVPIIVETAMFKFEEIYIIGGEWSFFRGGEAPMGWTNTLCSFVGIGFASDGAGAGGGIVVKNYFIITTIGAGLHAWVSHTVGIVSTGIALRIGGKIIVTYSFWRGSCVNRADIGIGGGKGGTGEVETLGHPVGASDVGNFVGVVVARIVEDGGVAGVGELGG